MPETNPQVLKLVEAELKKNPEASNPELLQKSKKIDPTVAELTARQFNARYPLRVKRAMAPKKPRKRKRSPAKVRKPENGRRSQGTERENVRQLLLQLAKDVGNAEGKGALIDIVAGIDKYVDRIVKATGN